MPGDGRGAQTRESAQLLQDLAQDLAQHFARHFGARGAGYCVEVGALDGIQDSNTLHFEGAGWRCLLVEADPEMAATCRATRPGSTVMHAAAVAPDTPPEVSFEVMENCRALSSLAIGPEVTRRAPAWGLDARIRRTTVPARTLDAMLEEWHPPRLDFVTIDVEGHEWSVLQGFSLARWRPEVLVLERNQRWPDWKILAHVHRHGYVHVRTIGVNDWYQRAEPGRSTSLRYRAGLLARFEAPLVARALIEGAARRALDAVGLRGAAARAVHAIRRRKRTT